MRIAFFSWESLHSIYVGGVAVHVSELAAALTRKGHEVHVFTRMARSDHARYERIDGVHYHRCPFECAPDAIDEIKNMCASFVNTFSATEQHVGSFDVIHAHDWLAAPALITLREHASALAVFTMHSSEYGRCGNKMFDGNSQRIRDLEQQGINAADTVIAVSRALKAEVQNLYHVAEEKIDAIYNGITYAEFDGYINAGAVKQQYDIGPLDPLLLYVGRMTAQKGPDLLIEAVPHVLKFYPSAKFFMAGQGDMRYQIEERARQLGVHHAMRFFGFLERSKAVDLYRACDCVCMPSRNEPFGIVVLEAWSAGKPIIATNQGGPSELIWHDINGLKVDASADSIAWGIGTLFSDFDHARWMGRNGRIAVETAFSWDIIADQTIAVYEA